MEKVKACLAKQQSTRFHVTPGEHSIKAEFLNAASKSGSRDVLVPISASSYVPLDLIDVGFAIYPHCIGKPLRARLEPWSPLRPW